MSTSLHVGRVAALLLALSTTTLLFAAAPHFEGLVEVKAKRVDSAWLLPDADFRQYTRVMIDPADVQFRKGWARDINRKRMHGGGSGRITDEVAREIAAAARSGFGELFEEAFRKAGWEIATESGPDVLRLSPAIVDLYIAAPDSPSIGNTRVYTVEAGEAKLVLAAHDSPTGALLGVAIDRRSAGGTGGIGHNRFQWTTSQTNRLDFERLFRTWAGIAAEGLEELKAQSPVSPVSKR